MNKSNCLVLELQIKWNLILYSHHSDYHPIFKEFKDYLRKTYILYVKTEKEQHQDIQKETKQANKQTNKNTGICHKIQHRRSHEQGLWKLGGSKKYMKQTKGQCQDNARKFCELEEEVRHSCRKGADQLNWNEGLRRCAEKIGKVKWALLFKGLI